MQRKMDDASKDGEYFVVGFQTLLILKVFVPERMSQEVETDRIRSTLK